MLADGKKHILACFLGAHAIDSARLEYKVTPPSSYRIAIELKNVCEITTDAGYGVKKKNNVSYGIGLRPYPE